MPRPSHYGEPAPYEGKRPFDGKKDPMRGVDPERLDRLSATIDRQMVEMAAIFRGDRPARGQALSNLTTLARGLELFVGSFREECEAAL